MTNIQMGQSLTELLHTQRTEWVGKTVEVVPDAYGLTVYCQEATVYMELDDEIDGGGEYRVTNINRF